MTAGYSFFELIRIVFIPVGIATAGFFFGLHLGDIIESFDDSNNNNKNHFA